MALRVGAIGKVLAAFVIVLGALGTQAEAVSILTFDQLTDGGTIAYNGTGGPATGTNVAFDTLVATGTPLNAGVYTCNSCVLNYTTGANTLETAPVGGVRQYQWAAGGSFVLTGTVVDPVTLTVIATGNLLTGTFVSATGTTIVIPGGANDTINFTGQGTDTKNPDLIAFFGITDNSFNFSNFEGSGSGVVGGNGSFTGTVDEADLINNQIENAPEPATGFLMLLGLASLAAAGIRRRS